MALTREQMAGLWGDGGPYSHVHVVREVRILDDSTSRTFYYVKANVNPTTYATLKAIEAQVEDEDIQAFLKDVTFVSDEEGYEWHVYGQPALTPRGANRTAARVTDVVIRMHRLVMDRLGLEHPRRKEAPGASGAGAATPAGDAESTS